MARIWSRCYSQDTGQDYVGSPMALIFIVAVIMAHKV